ncbi:MAG: hypothetical protein ACXW4M_12945, partial [Anaerolineales bacterium]
IIVVVGFIQTFQHARQASSTAGRWLLYLSFAPPLFLFLFSQWRSVYIERALLPSGAIFCIWLAWVITKTNLARIAQYALIGLLVISSIIGIYQHVTYQDFPYGPFKELDHSLRERIEPRDVIVHSNKLSVLPALLFERALPQSFIGDLPGSRIDTLAPATQQVLNIKAENDILTATENANRIWYIIFERAIEEYKAGGYPTHPDIQFLDSHYNLDSEENWGSLRVFLYTKAP